MRVIAGRDPASLPAPSTCALPHLEGSLHMVAVEWFEGPEV